MSKTPPGYNPIDLPGLIVDEGYSGRIVDPETGGGLFTSNTNPQIVGIDPITGEEAPLGTDVGFGASVRRWLQTGLYNGDFSLPTNNTDELIDNDYNPLPYWTWVNDAQGSVRAQVVDWASPSTGSTKALLFTVTAYPSTNEEGYIEQITPISNTFSNPIAAEPSSAWAATSTTTVGGTGYKYFQRLSFLREDLTQTGDEVEDDGSFYGLATVYGGLAAKDRFENRSFNETDVPYDAYYARLRLGVRPETSTPSSAISLYLVDSSLAVRPQRMSAQAIEPTVNSGSGGLGTHIGYYGTYGMWDAVHAETYYAGTGLQFLLGSSSPLGNTLDDYEEGTWTPTGNSVTFVSASGSYIKVGRLVMIRFNLQFPSTSDSSNSALVGSLPFTSDGIAGITPGIVTGFATDNVYLHLASGVTYFSFRAYNGNYYTNNYLSSAYVEGSAVYTTAT